MNRITSPAVIQNENIIKDYCIKNDTGIIQQISYSYIENDTFFNDVEYDKKGNKLTNLSSHYEYNENNLLILKADIRGNSINYEYDNNENIIKETYNIDSCFITQTDFIYNDNKIIESIEYTNADKMSKFMNVNLHDVCVSAIPFTVNKYEYIGNKCIISIYGQMGGTIPTIDTINFDKPHSIKTIIYDDNGNTKSIINKILYKEPYNSYEAYLEYNSNNLITDITTRVHGRDQEETLHFEYDENNFIISSESSSENYKTIFKYLEQ